MVRIVVFGIGKSFWSYIDSFIRYSEFIEIVAFIDNNSKYYDKKLCNIPIYTPEAITTLDFDGVVILSNKFYAEMKSQLIGLSIAQELIWDSRFIKSHILRGRKILYGNDIDNNSEKEKVLIISTNMNTFGGTRVAVYAARALKMSGKEVMLAAPEINPTLLDELIAASLSITVWESLPYFFKEDEEWINRFDIVIVNVFQMMNCACQICKIKPVLWWIHEIRSGWTTYYQDTQREFADINTPDWMCRLNIAGVSDIVSEAFNYYYPDMMNRVLTFGIPDTKFFIDEKSTGTVVFAVTAGFSELKGQQVLIDALKKLPDRERNRIEVWFIGPIGSSIEHLKMLGNDQIKMKFPGALSNKEVMEILPDIDVIVCPSLIESMSMSVVEGLMASKICITSDKTGIAQFIEDGKNGFVFKAGNADDLKIKVLWIINNKNQWGRIQNAARRTYEKIFSMDIFCRRLGEEIEEARRIYGRKM